MGLQVVGALVSQGHETVEMEIKFAEAHANKQPLCKTTPQGRATVEMEIKFGEAREDLATGGKMVMVVDGYNAPIR